MILLSFVLSNVVLLNIALINFRAIEFFNEADTLESSSILIYSELHAGLYTQRIGQDAAFIKW
jgi:hypothetical protein